MCILTFIFGAFKAGPASPQIAFLSFILGEEGGKYTEGFWKFNFECPTEV